VKSVDSWKTFKGESDIDLDLTLRHESMGIKKIRDLRSPCLNYECSTSLFEISHCLRDYRNLRGFKANA